MAALACSFASSRAETLNSDNLANGFTAADTTTALTTGRLRIGVFRTLTDIAISGASADNIQALHNDFVPLVDESQTFTAPVNGFFSRSDAFSGGSTVYSTAGGTATVPYDATPGVDNTANTTDLAGRTIYVWVLNDNNLADASQHGIYRTLQTLPDSDVVPPTEVTVSLVGATALVGSASGSNIGGTAASFSLANIGGGAVRAPEIQVFADGGGGDVEVQAASSVGYTGVTTFTVRNIGTDELNLATAVLSNEVDFSIGGFTAGDVSPASGANEEQFTVTWDTLAPAITKTTTLTIASNDPNEASFVITINAGDLVSPTTAPVVTTPTNNQSISLANLGDSVVVSGTATDNFAVTDVEVSLNNGPWVSADLAKPGTPSTTFSLAVVPNAGVNTLRVRTEDAGGNFSPITTRVFNVLRPLEINIVGSGTVTPAATFLPSPKNFVVGKVLTITGTPTAGNIFTGWTIGGGYTPQQIGVTPGALVKSTLTFTFRAGLTLTANFQANPFIALAGTYNGLVEETFRDFNTSANSTHGFFNATVQNTGAFTGKLSIDGFVLNVNGAFDHNGAARFGTASLTTIIVARTGKPSLKVSLNASLTAPFTIQGTVMQTAFQKSNIVAESSVNADRAFYGAQILPAGINAGVPNVAMASTAGRTVGEVVTGVGIPTTPPTTIASLNGAVEIILSASPTVTNAAANLTFTRSVDASYLTTAIDGTHNMILPSREAFYSVFGTFDDTLDTFDPGVPNDFQDDDIVVFNDDGGSLPTGITAGQEYFVVNKTGDAFQVSLTVAGAAVDITSPGGDGTAVLDPDTHQIEGLAAEDYPQGFGSGTLKVTKTGTVTLAGTLADGTPVSGSSSISSANEVALYSSIYTKKGFFSTEVKLNSADANSDISALTPAKWMRPEIFTSHYYPAGWVEPIGVDLLAARFFSTGTVTVLKREDDGATTDVDALADELIAPDTAFGNAELMFTDGQLEEDLLKTVSISATATTNVVTKVPDPLDPTFTLTLAKTTGLLGGSFTHTDNTLVPTANVKGIVYQKGAWAGGYGYFLTKQVVLDYTGESGFMGLFGIAP